jgi:hypothetical protein
MLAWTRTQAHTKSTFLQGMSLQGLDSSVGKAIDYGLDDRVRVPVRARIFTVTSALTLRPIQWASGTVTLGGKAAGA